MKYYVIIVLLAVGYLQSFAQQPRLKQVDTYQATTGRVVDIKSAPQKRYSLLNTLYDSQKGLMLNLPVLDDTGSREVMPLGYRLNSASKVELIRKDENLCESAVRPLYNESLFSGVSYLFCDSVVYGITLYYNDPEGIKQPAIRKNLLKFFKQADCERGDSERGDTVLYSDPDYAVRLSPGKLEVYSSFHYPVVETFYPGVSQKIWYGPFCYKQGDASLSLAFYNQESKENNIQSAFRIAYRYPVGKVFKMNQVRFILDDETYEYPLEAEYFRLVDGGGMQEECHTRTFIFPEVLKAMERSRGITVELKGEEGSFSYTMPAFQRASIHTAFEYFRWSVTNPMAKYRAW